MQYEKIKRVEYFVGVLGSDRMQYKLNRKNLRNWVYDKLPIEEEKINIECLEELKFLLKKWEVLKWKEVDFVGSDKELQWRISIYFEGEKPQKRFGSGAYPPGWEEINKFFLKFKG